MDNLREDCIFSEILEERKSLTGFLDAVFGFLSRKTDFYHVQKNRDDKIGFPRGIKEQILLSSMQKFEKLQYNVATAVTHCDEPPPAIEEVEIESSVMIHDVQSPTTSYEMMDSPNSPRTETRCSTVVFTENEFRNGAAFETYCWSQTLKDVEVSVVLPAAVKTGKHMKLNLKSSNISITSLLPNEEQLICGDTWGRYKHNDAVWTICDGKLILSFDKSKECWWDKLFTHELSIDIKKLDTERPISEFPEETQRRIEKIETEEMTNNEQRDLHSLPMSKSEQLSRLRQAWNADDSPFKGQTFDPSNMQFY